MNCACPTRFLRAGIALAISAIATALAAAPAFDPEAGLPHIRNFPPETYQGHNQIFASVEAPDGIMYFATYGAVLSFDGERWRQFAVPGTWIRALVVGPDGLIYVGGGNTLGRLEPAPGNGLLRFISLVDRLPAAHRALGTVWSAAPLGPDAVGFGIDGALLVWRAGAFQITPFPGARPALRQAGARVFCHVGDRLLEWQENTWRPFATDPRLAAARRLTALPHTAAGLRLALDHGLLLESAGPGLPLVEWPTSARDALRAGIRNGLRLADGSYVLSTAGAGLVFLGPDGTPLRRVTGASGLAHATTYGLAVARDGGLWVETANGLSLFDPFAPWSLFDQRNGRNEGLGGAPFRFRDRSLLDLGDNPPIRLQPAAHGLDSARFEPLGPNLPSRFGSFTTLHGWLLGATEQGVMRVDGEPRVLHRAKSQLEHIGALERLPGILVIGRLDGAEWVRIAPDATVTPLGQVPDFAVENTNIVELDDGTVWLGSTAGVALRLRLNPDGTLRDSTHFDATRGLPADAGWVKVEAATDGVLICVRQGVFRWHAATDRLEPHPGFARHWPAGINTLPIANDRAGRVWFQIAKAGGYELGCLDLRGAAATWTPLPAGITAPLGFGGARSLGYLRSGEREFLWAGVVRASARVDLTAIAAAPVASTPPPVVLTEFRQGDRRWHPRLDLAERFAFSREPLQLSFASPAAALGTIRYETRLVGLTDTWASATHPEINYTNLDGGPFTLEVRARDALDRVGEVARVRFSVAPPWHRSPAAYALYSLAGLGTVFGFVRWRLQRGERERRRLESLVATRTSELATARDQAEAASRAKSAFLASMSHELRTPLNGVIGYAQVLQSDPRLLPDQQERLRVVRSSGEHLLRMINDVLDLAKIEAGKLELRPAPFALRDVLADIAALHAPAAAAKRLAFATELAPEVPPWIEGDAQKLRQILDNFLGNAVKFTARGRITLRVERTSDLPLDARVATLRFSVQDTGPGIAPADQARLFQPFEQAHTDRPLAPGTGLGLAIGRALIERMGGTLQLESTPGAGSTFSFSVPFAIAQPRTATAHPFAIGGYAGPRRHVLIVDDHPVNRGLLLDLLRPLGFSCTAFSTGAECLTALARPDSPWPDLAILDVRMDGMDGLELTRRLRTLAGERPLRVLLTSASVLTFKTAEGQAAGADDFLAKPFHTADLLDSVGRLLALQWTASSSPAAPSSASPAPSPAFSLPPDLRAALLDTLELGDLDELRRQIAAARTARPTAASTWDALDAAAAGFQLAQLRTLLSAS